MKNIVKITLLILAIPASSMSMIIDSFDNEPDMMLSLEGSTSEIRASDSSVGTSRTVTINNRIAEPGASQTCIISSGSESFSSSINGGSTFDWNLNTRILYHDGAPFDLSAYSAFELDIPVITGAGHLIIELGSAAGPPYEESTIKIPITTTGTLVVPFEQVNFGIGSSISSFHATQFYFEAESEQFSFTLDEIRVVPEPSSLLLLLAGAGLLLIRRVRKR